MSNDGQKPLNIFTKKLSHNTWKGSKYAYEDNGTKADFCPGNYPEVSIYTYIHNTYL